MVFSESHCTTYNEADRMETKRILGVKYDEPGMQLTQIENEIKVRVKITQKEIFKIGELLCMGKKICQQENMGFQKWVDSEFDFSYPTANNFMNVYKQCLGRMFIACELPPSILYKVSKPSFPEELRDFLFAQGNLNEITGGQLDKIVDKYEKNGLEAVANDIENLQEDALFDRQIQYRFAQFDKALEMLDDKISKINKGEIEGLFNMGIEMQAEGYINEAKEINMILWNAIKEAHQTMEDAKNEAVEISNAHVMRMKEKYCTEEEEEKEEL